MRPLLSLVCVAALSVVGVAAAVPVSAQPVPAAAAVAVPDEVLVGYVVGASATDRDRVRGRASAQVKARVVQARADRKAVELLRLPRGSSRDRAIAELASDPAVAYAEPNWVYTHEAKPGGGGGTVPDYFGNGSLWGMYGDASSPANRFGSQAAEAWAPGDGGTAGNVGARSVYIGVIDTGIQHTHPDLTGQVGPNPGEGGPLATNGRDDDGNGYVDDVHGWDFVNGDSSIYDGGTRGSLDDHGTHVAGTIGAVNEDDTAVPGGAGQQGVVGVSQQVTLLNAKFLGRSGGTTADAVRAVDYFTDLKIRHGLDLVATSNSWGGGGFSNALLDAIVRGAQQDILFVAAAGNDGANNDTTQTYPANYDTTVGAGYDAVISVAAIDKTGALATFSNRGAATVDLGAPGVDVWSTTAYSTYSAYNGTSMATPHVSGGVALYAAANPDAGAAQIKQALLDATLPTGSLAGTTVTGGRLDVSGF